MPIPPLPPAPPRRLTSSSPQSHSSPSSRYPFPHLRPPYRVLVSGMLERHIPPPDCRYLSSSLLLHPLNTLGKGCLEEKTAGVSGEAEHHAARLAINQSCCPLGRFHLDGLRPPQPHPQTFCSLGTSPIHELTVLSRN